jgi:4-hydroxythreonine-4-phosphate dehydrogenase
VSRLPAEITLPRVVRAVTHLSEALARLSARATPRLLVAGLNPHAGEQGLFGDEELRVIGPAIERARGRLAQLQSAVCVEGPVGAETAFRLASSGEVEGVVAMMHDQATIASKLLDWGDAVNVTWGLPFVRTSVDHGVAYDAADSGCADARGMSSALDLAQRL